MRWVPRVLVVRSSLSRTPEDSGGSCIKPSPRVGSPYGDTAGSATLTDYGGHPSVRSLVDDYEISTV